MGLEQRPQDASSKPVFAVQQGMVCWLQLWVREGAELCSGKKQESSFPALIRAYLIGMAS